MHHNSPTVSIKLSFGYDATHTHARMFKTNKKMNLEYDHFHSLMITLSNAMNTGNCYKISIDSIQHAFHSELSILNRLLYTYLHGNQSAFILILSKRPYIGVCIFWNHKVSLANWTVHIPHPRSMFLLESMEQALGNAHHYKRLSWSTSPKRM